jgi:catechol 2,3-dioxygenase
MMQPVRIGHVVLKVRDLDRSLAFYRDLLGFQVAGEMSNVMIFLTASGENHHDLALLRVGDSAPSPLATAVGLYHVAIQLSDWEAVQTAHALLSERGLLRGAVDHGVTRSLYTADPDGNEIELYCDAPREEWEGRVADAMTVKPLRVEERR